MKITFVLPSFDISGGSRVLAIHARGLQERGHEVFAVAPPLRSVPFKSRVKSLLKGQGWPPRQPVGPSHFDGTTVPRRMLERYRPVTADDVPDADVIIATFWVTTEWVGPLPARKGVKAFFMQHHEANPEWMPPGYLERAHASYRAPFHQIAISSWIVEQLREHYGLTVTELVPNAVDLDQFQAPPRGKQAVPRVGMMYQSHPLKGPDLAIAALELLAQRYPGLELAAFGSQDPALPEMPYLGRILYEQTPPQDRLRTFYDRCDVWLMPSRAEGFGLPILEAMACRTPVVSSRTGAAPDLIEDGVNGYVVPVGDVAAMADRMGRVLALGEAEWTAMSQAAHATATRYTWADATARLEAALERAVARGPLS